MKLNYLNWLFIIFVIGVSIWVGMLILTSFDKELLVDMGKKGAALSIISVIGGLIQYLLKIQEINRMKKREELEFYRNILSDLKSVYDKMEKARLLIEAHRTAKTYGQEMRALIDGVVTIHNIKRALNPSFEKLGTELNSHLIAMNKFIKQLLDEYRDNYKEISILQELDEAQKKSYIISKTDTTEKGLGTKIKLLPNKAWKKLKKLDNLKILRSNNDAIFKEYELVFLNHLNEASKILRRRIPAKEKNNAN